MKFTREIVPLLCLAFCVQSVAADAKIVDAVRAALQKEAAGVPIEQLEPSPVPGLYQVVLGGTSGYVTADGKHFINGDLFDVGSRTNITETGRKQLRLSLLTQSHPGEAIVFGPKQPTYVVKVFTDVDCGYCRKLHSEVARYTSLGIAFEYLAYPRSGPGTDSWRKMEAVWCSADRRDALTRTKRGENVQKPASCAAPMIAEHHALGDRLGVTGTPMMLFADGTVTGYLPPEELLAQLQGLAKSPAQATRLSSK